MGLYNELLKMFSIENRPINELIEISSLIDAGKSNPKALVDKKGETAQIASMIVAFINEESTKELGSKLYIRINDLIVSQNLTRANAKSGKKLYEILIRKQEIGKYTVYRNRQGYIFNLKASSGELLATSGQYSKIESCLKGIAAVKKNSSSKIADQTKDIFDRVPNPKFEVYIDRFGEFRFRLKAKNGEILVVSEGYKNKRSCLYALESVKYNADSDIIEKA